MFGRDDKKQDPGQSRMGSTAAPRGLRLGRRSGATAATQATPVQTIGSPVQENPGRPGAKNRPTPSRREAQAARKRPIVPADREAAKRDAKVQDRAERAKQREAMYRGEDWALGPRDRGPERAYVRDVVDARWNVGEFLLPIMIIALPLSLLQNKVAVTAGFVILYGVIIVAILDVVLLNRRIAKGIRARFGHAPQRGTGMYVFSRSVQLRAGRVPRPRVKRGGQPI